MASDGFIYIDEPADRAQRLFLVSAGNVRRPFETDHLTRSELEPVEDPGQAWNALTIGAYTELIDTTGDPEPFPDWEPLAPPGELSPFSRTSVSFRRSWPHKPEVMFEGGNAARQPGTDVVDTPGGLQLLTTRSSSLGGRLLTTTAGTSPATAQAGYLAAAIGAAYPSFWPETTRALVVHSARWSERMLQVMSNADTRQKKVAALRRYGWGVPALDRALRSASDAVTLISQDEIRPYKAGAMREMNVHGLPWPVDELEALGNTPVEMRIALSYFIEPNPARRGWIRRFRYASHGLRFEVRRATESTKEFRCRINRLAQTEDSDRASSESDADQWFLGPSERVRGSLHVDLWSGTAADLAARGCLAVYPVTGWWKEQQSRDRSDAGVRYSLVVSIEASDIEVDLWTPVSVAAQIPVVIQTEVDW